MYACTFIVFVMLNAAVQTNAANNKQKGDDRIYFPGPIKKEPENRYGNDDDDLPEECKDKTYCNIKPPNYPQERYNDLIKHKVPLSQPSVEISSIGDRQGDPDEVDNCESIVEFEPLYKVRPKDGVWRTVVQAPEKNFVQLVRMETCKASDTPCFTIFPKVPTYKTFCKQKFTTWHFVVEEEPGKTVKIPVDLPTCCSCHYRPI